MSILHRLEGCGWHVDNVMAQNPSDPEGDPIPVQRDLFIMHQGSDQAWIVPLPISVADEIAGALRGEPPKKHIALPGGIPPVAMEAMRQMNGHRT